MALPAHHSEKGFTLVEVMISMVILAVGLLGSLVGVKAALDSNYGSSLRTEAVKIAQEQTEMARNMPYADLAGIAGTQTVQRQIRKTNASFTVNTSRIATTSSMTNQNMTQLTIDVHWTLKGSDHRYRIQTIVREAGK